MSPLNINANPALHHIFTVLICLSLLFWHPQQRERRISRWRRPPPPPRRLARTPPLAPSTLWVSPRPAPRQKLCPRSTPESPPQQVRCSHKHTHAQTSPKNKHLTACVRLHMHQHTLPVSTYVSTRRCSVIYVVPYIHSDDSRRLHSRGRPAASLYEEQHASPTSVLHPPDASLHPQRGAWVMMIYTPPKNN